MSNGRNDDDEKESSRDLKAMHQVWEQYRMADMFPELRAAGRKALIEHLVLMVSAHEARLNALERASKSRKRGGR